MDDSILKMIQQSEKQAQRRQEECDRELRLLQNHLEKLRERIRLIEAYQNEFACITKLKTEGAAAWQQLSETNKWKKSHLLALFYSQANPTGAAVLFPLVLEEANWRIAAPPHLVDDRELLLARASRKAFGIYHNDTLPARFFRLPNALVGDAQVIATVAHVYPQVMNQENLHASVWDNDQVFRAFATSYVFGMHFNPPQDYSILVERSAQGFGRFSKRLRSNRDHMVLAAYTNGLLPEVLKHYSEPLNDDIVFCLLMVDAADIKVSDDALSRFSDRLKADRELVLTYVQSNGVCLKDASPAIRGDLQIVCAASDKCAGSVRYCVEGHVKRLLGADRTFMLQILKRATRYDQNSHRELYQMLSEPLKRDAEMIIAACEAGCLHASDLPRALGEDPAFWKSMLAESATFYACLPDQYTMDESFVKCIKFFDGDNFELLEDMMMRYPSLRSDRDFWLTVIWESELYDEQWGTIYMDHSSDSIRNDREVMIKGCRTCSEIFPGLIDAFQRDREFAAAATENNPFAICNLPAVTQCLFPDLVAFALVELAREDDVDEYVDVIASDLWHDFTVLSAWFDAGGSGQEEMPESLWEDPKVCLMIAEKCPQEEFSRLVSKELKSDKAFMESAVQKNGMVYTAAEGGLVRDFDVTLAAFGGDQGQELTAYFANLEEEGGGSSALRYLNDFSDTVRERLGNYDGFIKGLLCGMSEFAEPTCVLQMLEQGEETSMAFKSLVSEFLGVPNRTQHALMLAAMLAMEDLPVPESSSEPCTCPRCLFGYDMHEIFGQTMLD